MGFWVFDGFGIISCYYIIGRCRFNQYCTFVAAFVTAVKIAYAVQESSESLEMVFIFFREDLFWIYFLKTEV